MNVDAHLAVRRMYVQLLRAEQLQRRDDGSSDGGAAAAAAVRAGGADAAAAAAAAEEPDPQPPVPANTPNPLQSAATSPARASAAPSPSPPAAASAPPARRRRRWLRRGEDAAARRTAPSASTARAESSARSASGASRRASWWPLRRRGSGQRSSSAARAGRGGGGAAEAQSLGEVRQWKLGIAEVLRTHCVVVEACLQNLLTEHVRQSLAAAAACVEEAREPNSLSRLGCTPASRVPVRVLSTGYAATVAMEAATDTATSGAAAEAGAHDRADAVAVVKAQHAEQTVIRPRPSLTAPSNPLVPPPQGGVSTVHVEDDEEVDDGAAERSSASRSTKQPKKGTTAETTPNPRAGPAAPSTKVKSSSKAAPPAPTRARRASATSGSSLCAQLEACPADRTLPWCTTGTHANPFLFTPTAAVCAGLHARQSRAARPPGRTPAGDSDADAAGNRSAAQCTLWEYVPLCSSLHATSTSSDGVTNTGHSSTAPTHLAGTSQARPDTTAHAPPPPPSGITARLSTGDPLALTTDHDWHVRQASLRAVQTCAAHLALSRGPAVSPPTLTAFTPTSVRSLAVLGASPAAVVEVHYSAAPSELQAVSWSPDTSYSRGKDDDGVPRVALHATWALCVEVDAVHAPWLLQTLLGVASATSPSEAGVELASAAGLRDAVRAALSSFAKVEV